MGILVAFQVILVEMLLHQPFLKIKGADGDVELEFPGFIFSTGASE